LRKKKKNAPMPLYKPEIDDSEKKENIQISPGTLHLLFVVIRRRKKNRPFSIGCKGKKKKRESFGSPWFYQQKPGGFPKIIAKGKGRKVPRFPP